MLCEALAIRVGFAQGVEGYWYGEAFQPSLGARVQWLVRRNGDGTYEIEFRRYEGCKMLSRHKEAGTWKLDDGVYSTETRTINGKRIAGGRRFKDEYAVEKLTQDEFQYRHLGTDEAFSVKRVSPGFEFPPCAT